MTECIQKKDNPGMVLTLAAPQQQHSVRPIFTSEQNLEHFALVMNGRMMFITWIAQSVAKRVFTKDCSEGDFTIRPLNKALPNL